MTQDDKPAHALQVVDFQSHPVWAFTNSDENDETIVSPVIPLPVDDLGGKLCGTEVTLANGAKVWALIGNVHPESLRSNEHFLSVSLDIGGQWFHLARYHDVDFEERGPQALALALGLKIDEVFPISYDLRRLSRRDSPSLSGQVLASPRERLSDKELIALAVGRGGPAS